MIQNSQYRAIPTDLQLNGPILSFTTTPSDTTLGVGQSTYFTGIATAIPTQVPANLIHGICNWNHSISMV